MRAFFRRLYEKSFERYHSARVFLWVLSFLEGAFLPFPVEIYYIPLSVRHYRRSFSLAFITTIGSVIGATLGYFVGAALMDVVESPLRNLIDENIYNQTMMEIQERGFLYLLIAGFSPFPYALASLAAGASGYSFFLYLVATILTRAPRYYLLGLLAYFFGDDAQRLYYRYRPAVLIISSCLVIIYVVVRLRS